MKIYIASRSGNRNFALEEGNVVAIGSGVYPQDDVKQAAIDHTRATDEPTWIYEVELTHKGSYRTQKEVVFAPAK